MSDVARQLRRFGLSGIREDVLSPAQRVGRDAKNVVAKRRISEMAEVNRFTFERLPMVEISKRTGFSQHKVMVLQFFLGWRHSSLKWAVKWSALPANDFTLAPQDATSRNPNTRESHERQKSRSEAR